MPRRRTNTRRPRYGRRKRFPRYRRPQTHYTTTLRYDVQSAETSVAGTLQLVFNGFNPSNSIDWGNCTNLWDQFRVLSMTIKYFPLQQPANSLSTRDIAPLYAINDYNDLTALASTAEALSYQKVRTLNLFRQWKHTMRWSTNPKKATSGEGGWHNTGATPPSVGGIKMISDTGLDASTTYGRYVIEHVVQFKNRR